MKYLLDTCVISELIKKNPSNNVLNWIKNIPEEKLFLSVITIAEIYRGLNKLPNSKRKKSLTNWLNTLVEDYKNRIITIDFAVAENWGIIQEEAEKKGKRISSIDCFVASIAYTHNFTLATRNTKDFQGSNISIDNPWD